MPSEIPVLIPAYNPSPQLEQFIRSLLKEVTKKVIVVNDGSDSVHQEMFERIKLLPGVMYVEHNANLGKGQALKTGLKLWQTQMSFTSGIVTADADGQHISSDIHKIITELSIYPDRLILGVREFSSTVPWRSRMGNILTRQVFKWMTGRKLQDTQTGLRGIPCEFINEAISAKGSGYEYETNMLLMAIRSGILIREVPITTIYTINNKLSHFRPFIDSVKIYWVLFRYIVSSLIAATVDFGFFSLIIHWVPNITIAMLISRYVIGSLINFTINRSTVFHDRSYVARPLLKYYVVATISGLLASGIVVLFVNQFNLSIMVSKIIAETLLFPVGFILQKNWVFFNRDNKFK